MGRKAKREYAVEEQVDDLLETFDSDPDTDENQEYFKPDEYDELDVEDKLNEIIDFHRKNNYQFLFLGPSDILCNDECNECNDVWIYKRFKSIEILAREIFNELHKFKKFFLNYETIYYRIHRNVSKYFI